MVATQTLTATFDGYTLPGANGTDAFSGATYGVSATEYDGARVGGIVTSTRAGMRSVRVDGYTRDTTSANLQTTLATLKRRLAAPRKRLVVNLNGDARYWIATLSGQVAITIIPDYPLFARWTATFLCEDPFARAVTPSTAVLTPTLASTSWPVQPGGADSFYAALVLANSPLAYWRLGDPVGSNGAADASGNGAYLGYTNAGGTGVVYQQTGAIPGDTDTAVQFNYLTPGAIYGAKVGALWAINDSWTVHFRFKLIAGTGAEAFIVSDNGAGTPVPGRYFPCISIDATGHIKAYPYVGGTALATSTATITTAAAWHHVAVVKNGASGVTIYIDGTAGTSAGTNATFVDSVGGTVFLGNDSTAAKPVNGYLDEVAIVPSALTAAQVADLSAATALNKWAASTTLTTAGEAPAPITALVCNLSGGPTPLYWALRDATAGVWPQRQLLATAPAAPRDVLLFDPTMNGVWKAGLSSAYGYWPGWDPSGSLLDMSGASKDLAAPASLTLSGGLITDTTRTTATEGDGAAVPGGVGIYETYTNDCANGNAATNTNGWSVFNGPETITRTTAEHKFGTTALQVVTTIVGGGFAYNITGLTVGTIKSAGVWVKCATVGASLRLIVTCAGNLITTTSFTATGDWQYVTITATVPTGATNWALCVLTTGSTALTFYVGGVEINTGSIAFPYKHTAGSTATNTAGRIQASSYLLNATQGWAAFRVKMGWVYNNAPSSTPTLLAWSDDSTHRLLLYYDQSTQKWTAARANSTSTTAASAVQAFALAATVTVIAAWTATTVAVSVDGGAFVSAANTTIPTLAATLADLGSNAASTSIDSTIIAAAVGTGTLTNADAATLQTLLAAGSAPTAYPSAAVVTATWNPANSYLSLAGVTYAQDGAWRASTVFDGNAGFLDTSASGMAPTGDFTVGAWVYPTAIGTARGIISKASTNTGFALRMNASGQIIFEVGNSTTTRTATSTGILVAGRWTLVLATFTQATGTLQVWIAGNPDGNTGTTAFTPAAGSNNLRLGSAHAVSDATASYWYGGIEGAFLHGAVLTLAQIQKLQRYGSLVAAIGSPVRWEGQFPECAPDPEAATTSTLELAAWALATQPTVRAMLARRTRYL